MSKLAVFLAALALLIVSIVRGAEPSLQATCVERALKLDGQLDDPGWQRAKWTAGFRQHADPEKPAPHDTRFALVCDDQFLYVGAEMAEPQIGNLVARVTTRDGKIYRDDCVQIFIDPIRTDSDYFCFTINSGGALRDTKGATAAWDSEAKVAAHVSARAWAVEVMIPLGDLELEPEALTSPWGFNLTRVRRAGPTTKLSTYAPIRGTFHQPAQFAPLAVPEQTLEPYVWKISEPTERTIHLVAGKPVLDAKVQIENLTGRFRFFLLVAEAGGESARAKGQPLRDGLDNRDRHFVGIRTPTAGLDEGLVILSLYDALAPQRLLARRQYAAELAYSPLELTMTVPWYKNAIFATQQIDKVELLVRSDLPADELKQFTMVASIRDLERTVAGPVREDQVSPEARIAIPTAELPVGDYRVQVALVNREEQTVHRATTRLRKLAPRRGEVRFDRSLGGLVDGKPFMTFGWFGVRHGALEAFAADGYNTVGAYGPCTSMNDDEIRAYLDKAHALGLKVICRPQPNMKLLRSAHRLLTKAEAEELRACVRKWRSHPALLAWYMCDEPEGKPEPLERRLEEYRIVDEEDPYHPAIVLNNTVDGIHKYHVAGDLLMPDVYPGFLRRGGASRIDRPTNAMIAGREAAGGRKPVWVTPQGQIQQADGHRGPTFRELRNQAWQCAAHDAMGFFWYRDSFLTNLAPSKIGTPYIHRELLAVADAVRSKSRPGAARASVQADELTLGVKSVGEHRYVIGVSLSTEGLDVAFEAGELGDRPLLVLSEGRRIEPKAGRFSDHFEPYEAHGYTTDLWLTDLPTVAEIEALIAKEIQARHKPGNLAYQTTGAQAIPQHHDGQALFLNDGCTTGVWWPREWGKPKHPLPNWVDIQLPEPREVSRVVIYSVRAGEEPPSLRDGNVQAMRDGQWTTLGRISGNERDPATIVFEPLTTQRLRLVITRTNGRRITLQEIEAYAR